MAYNGNLPADDGYLSEFPAQQRENQRALKEDKIANAGKLQGLIPGNNSGQIPINNGALNINLNAEKLGGHAANFFSPDGHKHGKASPSGDGFMSAADKKKLDGVQVGAEVNQNAFSKIKIGDKELVAAVKQAVLELIAGDNIKITPDADGSKITIDIANKKEIFDPDNYYTKDKADERYYHEDVPLPVAYSNEVNFAGNEETIQFGFRDHNINTYRFGNGTQGGLADISAKALDGNLCSGSFNNTQQMNDWLRQHYTDENVYACRVYRANEIVINGNKQWGTVLISAYPVYDGRALIMQLFFANSVGLFYRYLNTPDEIDNTNNWYQIVGTNNENKLKIGNNYIWFA